MFSCEYYELFKNLKNTAGGCSVVEIHRELDYINGEIDDIYFQYNTLCLCYAFLHFNNKYMIVSTQITNTEIFAFMAVLFLSY